MVATAQHSRLAFFREWMKSPTQIGAICPSGKHLANAMAAMVPQNGSGLVIELGAGTGAITDALIRSGIDRERLRIFDRSPVLVSLLQARFPDVAILQGDAANLSNYLESVCDVDCIVSSLPLLSMPSLVRTAILDELGKFMSHGTTLVQYTYGLTLRHPFDTRGCACTAKRTVFLNVPPAKVCRYEMQ